MARTVVPSDVLTQPQGPLLQEATEHFGQVTIVVHVDDVSYVEQLPLPLLPLPLLPLLGSSVSGHCEYLSAQKRCLPVPGQSVC